METLLLLHGAIGAADQLKALKEKLSDKFDVHVLDFSGHGASSVIDTSFGIQLFSQDVLLWMKNNNKQTVNIFGYSMGGYVALYLAAHYPEKVKKVFTLATKFAWDPETAQRESKMLDPQKIVEKVPQFAAQLEKRHQSHGWQNVLSKTTQMMVSLGNNPILTDDVLSKVKCPVTIAVGDKDTMVTLEETITTFRKISNARLLVMPEVPHPIEKVPVDRLAYKLERFFN